MYRLIFPQFLLIISSVVIAQTDMKYDPLSSPNSFQSKGNPYYWRNKMPHKAYWQQDVHYTIKADINEKDDVIRGSETLTYWNNSPDTLYFVFFHLYQNAFQPGSYYDELHKENKVSVDYGKYESQGLGTVIEKLQVSGKDLKQELENTILKVYLKQPLFPNASIQFDIKFKTYFDTGSMRRRMKIFKTYGNKHYDGVHWYPRISVYDRKFGWTTDQHLGREFYGDFGTYDVELTFANNYIVEATGFLQNREEVLPKNLRNKLDISNFKDKPWGEKPSIIIEYDTSIHKTWKYHAENVHDFAFTADPTYRIGTFNIMPYPQSDKLDSMQGIVIVQEPHASKWQIGPELIADIIKIYSKDFGMYAYPKMVAADARDGMEYPMLTLDGGSNPGFRGLFCHEIAHNWFYGMVGNNETYRASLDEGFTQFLTSWSMKLIDGDTIIETPEKCSYKRKFKKPTMVMDRRTFGGYIKDAMQGLDPSLNTHSDDFGGALRHGGGYGHVYYKTASMLYNLQYVLGNELFLKAMQHYFNTWKMSHPYYNDFRNSIINYTKVDLNWFFDQWLETSKSIDYSIVSIKKGDESDTYKIKFKRKGTMQMPLDFVVIDKKNKEHHFHIPNNWFTKKTGATVLDKWIGWGNNLYPTHEAIISIPNGIKNVIIDPSNRLADINRLNNNKKTPVSLRFDSKIVNRPNQFKYEYKWRPDVWYNAYDGFKMGLHLNGNYMNYRHIFDATVWYNSGLAQGGSKGVDFQQNSKDFDPVSIVFNYKTNIPKFSKNTSIYFSGKWLDGLIGTQFGANKQINAKNEVYGYFKTMYRLDSNSTNYLLLPNEWDFGQHNNTINLGYKHSYHYAKGNGSINFLLKSSSILSDYNYAYLEMEFINKTNFGKFELRTRLYARYGTSSNLPSESSLFIAGANPEDMMENKYMRSQGIFASDWSTYGTVTNTTQFGGGLNLRGYAGYFVTQVAPDGSTFSAYKGNTGASINVELDFDKYINLRLGALSKYIKMDLYLFGDAGTIQYNSTFDFTDIRMDAGIGTAFTIKKFGPLETVKPLTIRFDMPFVLSHTPFADPTFVQFRWVIGINRAF